MIAEDWPKYATRPGRNETPLDELSFEAWIKQYKPSENFINRAVSYYEKGLWTAMALDLELRLATGGRRGLPEMFRWLWERFGRAGAADRPRPTCATPPRAVGGPPLDRFFDRYVRGTDELPLPGAAGGAPGLNVAARAEWDESAKRARRSRPRAQRAGPAPGPASRCTRSARLVRNVVPGVARLARRADVQRRDRRRRRRARRRRRRSPSASPTADPGARVPHRLLPPRRAARGDADAGREPRARAVPPGRRAREQERRRRSHRLARVGPARMIHATARRAAPRGPTVILLAGFAACAAPAAKPARRARARAPPPPTRSPPRASPACAPTSAMRGRRSRARSPICRAPPRTTRSPHAPGAPWPVYIPADEDRGAVAAALARRCPRPIWPASTCARCPRDAARRSASTGLLYLPRPYVVPGGRFNEMYGWDSYFIVLGPAARRTRSRSRATWSTTSSTRCAATAAC